MNNYKETKRITKTGIVEESRSIVLPSSAPYPKRHIIDPEKKAFENKKQSIKHFSLLIDNNFNHTDMVLTLTFSSHAIRKMKAAIVLPNGCSGDAVKSYIRDQLNISAAKEARNFLRKVNRLSLKKVKYLFVVSDVNSKTNKETRVHIHMIISGDDFGQKNGVFEFCGKDIKKIWTHGYLYHRYLYANTRGYGVRKQKEGDHTDIATYFIDQTRTVPGKKRVITSQNLALPREESEFFIGDCYGKINVPKGCLEISRTVNPFNPGYQSVRYYDERYDETKKQH